MADSVVTSCNSLKEQLKKERKAQKNWNRKYGIYLKEKEFIEEEIDRVGLTQQAFWRKVSFKKPQAKYDEVGWEIKPVNGIPITSSAMIGWRSTFDYSLERVGPLFVSPLHTLPQEPKQHHIILG